MRSTSSAGPVAIPARAVNFFFHLLTELDGVSNQFFAIAPALAPGRDCVRTGLSAREVQRALTTLLLRDLVEVRPGGRFRRRNPRH